MGANCPHGSGRVFLREHGTSFDPGRGYSGDAAIPEAASRWGETLAPSRGRTVSRCLRVRFTRQAETAWDFHRSVWSTVVSRRNHQSPHRVAAPNRTRCREERRVTPWCFGRLGGLAPRLGPKRDSSRTVLAWPLRQRPLPAAAGCVPLPCGRVRARISARARPRTGRIRPVGVGPIAPFETEPITPAAHA